MCFFLSYIIKKITYLLTEIYILSQHYDYRIKLKKKEFTFMQSTIRKKEIILKNTV